MKGKTFLRQKSKGISKLGKNRKKLQKWRKPKGRDSKMRLHMSGNPVSPSVGFKKPKKDSGKIQDKTPIWVHNTNDLENFPKNSIAILAKVGAKKKLEIIKSAEEKKISIVNLKVAKK